MSNAIQFLESLGGSAEPMSAEQYARAVAALDVDAGLRQALLERDGGRINQLLGGRGSMMLVLAPADEKPADNDRTEDDGEGDDEQEIRAIAA
jgi:hypothetical protein